MKVSIINKSRHQLPKYETSLSAGMDLCGDFSRIDLVNGKPKKFFFDADVVAIGLVEAPDAPFVSAMRYCQILQPQAHLS